MNIHEFKTTLGESAHPPGLSKPLDALWIEANGDWDKAHRIVQILDDQAAEWVHAYLHRKEGDLSNASYWYHRANRVMPDMDMDEEWDTIAAALLSRI